MKNFSLLAVWDVRPSIAKIRRSCFSVGLTFLLVATNAFSQTNVYSEDQQIHHLSNSELNSSGAINETRIQIGNTGSGLTFNALVGKDLIGCKEIVIEPNTTINSPVFGSVTFSTGESLLNVFSYSHNDLSSVRAVEKFETGVQIPQAIIDSIEYFRNTDDSTNGLNPFLQWDISLKATYRHVETNYVRSNYGFYYEDYVRNTTSTDTSHWGWTNVPVNEPFRVRYSFPEEKLGLWELTYELYVNGELYHSYCPFVVNVIEKDAEDGYVKVATNNKMLTRNGELFLPIGHNLKWPERESCSYDLTCQPCESAAHVKFDKVLSDFAEAGGDYFRMHLSPVSFDVEFEKIGNYFNRLNYAVEIDKVLEFAEANNMYIDFNMLVHYAFSVESAYGMYGWDWSGAPVDSFDVIPDSYAAGQYCYASAFGLTDPSDFLTHEGCKKFYKQRLRYLISRFGYCDNIAMFELMSEINQVGDVFVTEFNLTPQYPNPNWRNCYTRRIAAPYTDSLTREAHQIATHDWHQEMARYIKNELGHKDQLVTCSYAGGPGIYDESFGIPELDIISYNNSPEGFLCFMPRHVDKIAQLHATYNKPVIFGETGPFCTYCDGGTAYVQQLWQHPFTGLAGFNYWDGDNALLFEPLWQKMFEMKNWILNDPMKTSTFLGDFDVFSTHSDPLDPLEKYYKKELNYIARVGESPWTYDYAFGSLINTTENYYTTGDFVDDNGDTTECYKDFIEVRLIPTDVGIIELDEKVDLGSSTEPIFRPFPFVTESPAYWLESEATFQYAHDMSRSETVTWSELTGEPFGHPYSCITDDCPADSLKESSFPFSAIISNYDLFGLAQLPISESNRLPIVSQTPEVLIVAAPYSRQMEQVQNELERKSVDANEYIAWIYDLSGKLLAEKYVVQDSKGVTVPISGLSKGCYLLYIQDKNGTIYTTKWLN